MRNGSCTRVAFPGREWKLIVCTQKTVVNDVCQFLQDRVACEQERVVVYSLKAVRYIKSIPPTAFFWVHPFILHSGPTRWAVKGERSGGCSVPSFLLLRAGRDDVLCSAACWQCSSASCRKPARSRLRGSLSFLHCVFVLSLSEGFEADGSHLSFYLGKGHTDLAVS